MPFASIAPQDRLLQDQQIVLRVRRGESELFEILMRRHNQTVYRTIRSILRGEAEVEDAMQQTYLSAFAKLEQFEGTSKFSTWLVRIAINEAIGRREAGLRLVPREQPELEEALMPSNPENSPEDQAAAKELRGWLRRAIDDLPELYRTVVMLRDVEGMSTQEAAEILTVSEDTIKTRLHRARALLRDRMEADVATSAGQEFQFLVPRCDRVVAAVMQIVAGR